MNGTPRGTARLLTGTGRSAIATIQISGDLGALDCPSLLFRAANGKLVNQLSLNALCFGVWGEPGEDVVVCRTADDTLEITCHGGTAAVARVLGDVAERGFAEESGKRQPAEASEADTFTPIQTALMHARTQRTAEILLEQASGVWQQFLLSLNDIRHSQAQLSIQQALSWSEFGRHLVEPWNVVLCGRPNVGKSSLMNALAGFTRSIVSEQAGTTRDRVTLETAIDGWPVCITDTAGVRVTEDPIELEGVQQTLSAMAAADLVVVVLDGSEPLQPEDHQLLNRKVSCRLVIAHKSDLPRSGTVQLPERCLEVSSVSGQGIDTLLHAIAVTLVPDQPVAGQAIPILRDHEQWLRDLRDLGR